MPLPSLPAFSVLVATLLGTAAQAATPTPIYTCTDAQGRKQLVDRRTADCAEQTMKVKNSDGSDRGTLKPPLTETERAAAEAAARLRDEQDAARRVKERADGALVRKYPNEQAHAAQRAKELTETRAAMLALDQRIAALRADRKKLADEEEFYVGKPLPAKLRQDIDAVDAALAANRAARDDRQQQIEQINGRFDKELAQLKQLWAQR